MVESCGDAGTRTESGGAGDVRGDSQEEPEHSGRSKDQRNEAKKQARALRRARRDLPYRVTAPKMAAVSRAPVSSYWII